MICTISEEAEDAENAEDASHSTDQQYEADWSAVGAPEPQRQLRAPRDLMELSLSLMCPYVTF